MEKLALTGEEDWNGIFEAAMIEAACGDAYVNAVNEPCLEFERESIRVVEAN